MEVVNTEMQAVSADLYSQAQSDSAAGEDAEGEPASEEASETPEDQGEVIDADFEMVDEDKK